MAVSAPVDCEPLVATEPDHPPEAVHEVAGDNEAEGAITALVEAPVQCDA